MTYVPRFPGSGTLIEETLLKGRAEGEAKAILRVLAGRGIEVPDSVRERVMACVDLEVLETWVDRSLTVASAEELFVEE